MGLGTAYIAGFKWALERDYAYILEMDADFSHDPIHLPQFLDAIKNADLVLGSRYQHGRVTVVNWPMTRLILSYCANIYARNVTGLQLWDATGGFKCFRREVLEAIDLDDVRSNGYAFQIEMSFRAWKKQFRIAEIPIVFVDRTEGTSKMSNKIVREAVWMVWRLRWWALTGAASPFVILSAAKDLLFQAFTLQTGDAANGTHLLQDERLRQRLRRRGRDARAS